MESLIYIPESAKDAGAQLRSAFGQPLEQLPKPGFIRTWSSVAYLFPGLHPDGYEDTDSGWPRVLRRIAAEAWRRAENGELKDDELYPSDAQWSGLYDQITNHTAEETERRTELAGLSAKCANA